MNYDNKTTRRKTITTRDVWQIGLETFRATKRQVTYISALGFFAPYILFSLFLNFQGIRITDEFKQFVTSGALAQADFMAALQGPLGFFKTYLISSLLFFIILMASYFSLIQVAINHLRSQPPLKPIQTFLLGLKTSAPKGLVVSLLLIPIYVVGQVLEGPGIVAGLLALMIPVILVAENRGALSAFGEALTLRYVRRSQMSKWNVFFALASFGALFYVLISVVGMARNFLLYLDEWLDIPKTLWFVTLADTPITPVYILVTLFEAIITTGLVSLIPTITSALYFMIVGKRDLGAA